MSSIGKSIMPVSLAVGGLATVTGKTAVEFLSLKENTRTAFKVLLGSIEESEAMLDNLYSFAKKTPFPYATYLKAGKTLVAMGVSADKCIPYLDGITNAAIATGTGEEGINTLTEAIGQMSAKGKVQLVQLNSLMTAGIPAAKILGNAYGVTAEEIYKMISQGRLAADVAIPKLIEGMNKGTDGVNGMTAAYGGLANEMKGTLSGTLDSLKSKFKDVSLQIWDADNAYPSLIQVIKSFTGVIQQIPKIFSEVTRTVSPLLDTISTKLQSLSDKIDNMNPELLGKIGTVILGIAAAAPILAVTGGAIAKVGRVISSLVGIFSSLGSVLSFIASPIGLIILAIAALAAIFVYLISTNDEFKNSVMDLVNNLMTNLAPVIASIGGLISNIVTVIMNIIEAIMPSLMGVINSVMSIIKDIAPVVTNILSVVINVISAIITAISPIVTVVVTVLAKISEVVTSVLATIVGFINDMFEGIKNNWTGLVDFVSWVIDGIRGAFDTVVNIIKGIINGVIDGINFALGVINMIPGVQISPIEHLLHGTDDWQGGFARMNEGGRGELTYLPNGSQVIPHDISVKYAKESARINNNTPTSTIDTDNLVQGIATAILSAPHQTIFKIGERTVADVISSQVDVNNGRTIMRKERFG